MNESDQTVGAIFDVALQLPPGQRDAYVKDACAGDLVLRRRVEVLLLALESAGDFMKGPAVVPQPHTAPVADVEAEHPHLVARHRMVEEEPADEGVGQTFGRYRLLEKIGEGGCGAVYVAEQKEPVRRHVAIKVIKLGMDTRQVIARFDAERQALAMMDHPHIAKVLDGGASETGRPYFVMELVRGIPMTTYCDQAHLNTDQRLELFIQVCQAIQHAHQKGIIHRDIKPSNILVTLHDGVPVPKVIDFGIAKAMEGRLTEGTVYTRLHQFIGTPAYMSPEQAEMTGLDVDTRSDIYSLGVLLYELLSGRTPFDAKELMASGIEAMRKIIREQEPMRPSTRLMQIQCGGQAIPSTVRHSPLPSDLDWIVMKCLEKDRTRRYETANGLASDLKRHLNDEPVVARPPSAAYRIRKALRRHWLAFTTATVVALSLVVGMGVSTRQTLAARKAQRETEAARGNEAQANELLRVQIAETESVKRSAQAAAQSEGEQRLRAEEALELMQVQRAEELFAAQESVLAVGYLGRVLTANPSHELAAARLASAMLRLFGRELTEPLVHQGYIHSAQFSPDGLRVVTASQDQTARLWDARTGQPWAEPLRHGSPVLDAQFSPDGLQVVTASADHTARVWNVLTGQPVIPAIQHELTVHSAQFSPDGMRLLTASDDQVARVWDARTGQPVTGPLRHDAWVWSAQFSPDGLRVVTASNDRTVRIWDARTGRPLTEPFRHGEGVGWAQYSPDGFQVVTASADWTARVWDTRTGQPVTEPLRHGRNVVFAQFSPTGFQVVTASADGTARVWDARTGKPVTEPFLHKGSVLTAQFSPDGGRVVTASDDSTARVWDVRTGQPVSEPLRHRRNVRSAEFSPDGTQLVTGSTDGTARIWDARSGPPVATRLQHAGPVASAEFSPDGTRVVSASADHTARIWDARTGQEVTSPLRHMAELRSAQFSPNGLRVVTASHDKTARIWDARTGLPLTQPLAHEAFVAAAQFSPDGARVVTVAVDSTARIWDARTGQPLTEPFRDPGMKSAEFSPDGSRVVTASAGNSAQVWDARTGLPSTAPLLHEGFVVWAQFSPDGTHVVTAAHDFTARVWDAFTSQPVTAPMGHGYQVISAQFSPDGRRLVTASWDKTARLWDARTGQPLTEPLRHDGTVWSAQFSHDGRRVVTGSDDQTARVWDARTGQPLTDPLRQEGTVTSARFSLDGRRVVTAGSDHSAWIWDVSPPPLPVPPWFLDWVETRVGHRFDILRANDNVPLSEHRRRREQVQSRTDTGFYTRLAQWVEAEPATRAISPNAAWPPTADAAPISAP